MTEVAEPDTSEGRALLSNSTAMVASRVVAAVLGWAGTVVIARTLSPDDWGRYSFVFGLLGIMALVTDLGVGRVVIARLTSDDPAEARRVAGSFILLRVLLGLFGFGIAVAYAAVAGLSVALVAVVAFAATGVVLATPSNALLVLYQARLRLVPVAGWDVLAQVVQFATILAIARFHPTLAAFVLPSVIKEVLVLAARGTGLLRGMAGPRPTFSAGTAYWREMLREAVPISIGFALIMLLTKVDILLLQLLDSYEAVGRYAIGYKFSDLLIVVTVTIAVPFTTVLVRAWPDDHDTFRLRTRQAMAVAGVLGALAVVAFWPAAGFLIRMLYGEEFVEAGFTARLLVVSSALSGVTNIALVALVAARKLTGFPVLAAGGVLLNVVLNLVAIPRWSYDGAAVATLVTEGIMFVAGLVLAQRSLGISRLVPWGPLTRQVLLALSVTAPAAVLVGFSGWPWIPVVAVAALVYLSLVEFTDSVEYLALLGRIPAALNRTRKVP